ncbi:hypothetical protein [Rathayibacter soli]|uniref:hypothetical protein n=1 Tax=Rathayibacter soli TaxID=3144168 RepID=UPI0027E3F7A0|nr:hypothetical protein [Glaciibacter superstes]
MPKNLLRLLGLVHAEVFTSWRDGTPIYVACDCPIGVDHPAATEERDAVDDQSVAAAVI